METLYFDLLRFGYHVGLAVLIGGGIVLGAAAAPAVFRSIRARSEAGNVFAAILKAGAFEEDPRDWRILARWVVLALMSGAVLYGVAWAGPVARTIRRETPGFDDLPEGDLRRREFRAMHRRASTAFSLVVVLGLVALFFS